ncbi:MAG: hypothetical protein CVU81_00985 [Euryarchaeota archaeon HGW-Euryarchaeota-1]|nr:MAG: hypothetical protein CVU81_00985 [Euryarchaeota archaeon HGW-Euryarchaeota-1]
MFVSKYAPASLNESEFIGNKKAVETARRWLRAWPKEKKAILLLGDAGIGKTTLATLLAKEFGYELFEVNASDTRNKDAIIHQLAPATLEQGLFSSRRLVLIDEVDGMAGNQDRGGLLAIIDVLQKTKQPLILTANDAESKKIESLEKYCLNVVFEMPAEKDVVEKLRKICENEGIQASDSVLSGIVKRSRNDIRNSINMLELVSSGKKSIDDSKIDLFEGKDILLKEKDILFRVLKTKDLSIALDALSAGKSDFYPTDLIQWFEENLPYVYKNKQDMAAAYSWLAQADKFAGYIKGQNWQYLTNVARCLASISTAKEQSITLTSDYKFKDPWVGLMIWQGRRKQQAADDFCKEWAPKLHISWKKMKSNYAIYEGAIGKSRC